MFKFKVLATIVFFGLVFASFANAQSKQTKAKLEVVYFHATNRCPTCNAVEDNAKKLLNNSFKTELKNGTIKFASYNLDEKENKALVEKYKIAYSTLLLIKADGTTTDLTSTGFEYALENPGKYADLLKAEINKKIK